MGATYPLRWIPHFRREHSKSRRFDVRAFIPPLRARLLVLQPTPFCNIDCDYCYLPNRQDKSRMSMGTVALAARRLADDQLAGPSLTVVWHSGEPLVLPPSFYEEAFDTIADAIGRDCKVTHSIQTNGTLINDQWCELFARRNVQIGVSVDGPADLHDRHRRTRNGKGPHHKVLAGMALLRPYRTEKGSAARTRNSLSCDRRAHP